MMLQSAIRPFDELGHHPACLSYGKEASLADEKSTHVDFYCDCHGFPTPMVLKNGTDVAWPAGWTQERADEWRRANHLSRPTAEPATSQSVAPKIPGGLFNGNQQTDRRRPS